jgi:hypothetical protein
MKKDQGLHLHLILDAQVTGVVETETSIANVIKRVIENTNHPRTSTAQATVIVMIDPEAAIETVSTVIAKVGGAQKISKKRSTKLIGPFPRLLLNLRILHADHPSSRIPMVQAVLRSKEPAAVASLRSMK